MMKINWKVRIQKKSFWVFIVGFIGSLVTATLPRFGIVADVQGWEQWAYSIIQIVFGGLAGLGIVVDNTTPGLGDSERVLNPETVSEPTLDVEPTEEVPISVATSPSGTAEAIDPAQNEPTSNAVDPSKIGGTENGK
ncbi:phage holin [Paucilactobacillus nenjiangensis]|nr:phage holin [Paucilactobacillus nenjiangensis]